jgi:hypothetical protein
MALVSNIDLFISQLEQKFYGCLHLRYDGRSSLSGLSLRLRSAIAHAESEIHKFWHGVACDQALLGDAMRMDGKSLHKERAIPALYNGIRHVQGFVLLLDRIKWSQQDIPTPDTESGHMLDNMTPRNLNIAHDFFHNVSDPVDNKQVRRTSKQQRPERKGNALIEVANNFLDRFAHIISLLEQELAGDIVADEELEEDEDNVVSLVKDAIASGQRGELCTVVANILMCGANVAAMEVRTISSFLPETPLT